jgi:hypothetical protein
MSDQRQFERDPNLSRNSYSDNRSSLAETSAWIAVIIAILVVVGAINFYGGRGPGPNSAGTTSGQSTRAPVPNAPPATAVPATSPARPAPQP